jgi:hypothetical protein
MNVSALKSQNINQYIHLLTNPVFIKAVKNAANEDGPNGKYDALFENLEKLSKLLADNGSDSEAKVSETSNNPTANLFLTAFLKERKESEASKKQTESMARLVDELIANADLLEAMMDLEVTPSIDEEISLFQKFISIIRELDAEVKKIEKSAKAKEVKSIMKLMPSADTESGFKEVMILVVK